MAKLPYQLYLRTSYTAFSTTVYITLSVSQVQKPVVRIPSTLNPLPQNPYQPVTLKPKWINKLSNQPDTRKFHGRIPSNFRFCNLPHVCHEGTASPWYMTWKLILVLWVYTWPECSFLSYEFRNWKNALCAKPTVSVHMRAGYRHKEAVTKLIQPGHVGEQLKERIESQNEENMNCLLKIVRSIHLSRQGIVLRKGKQDEESNFKHLLLLRAERKTIKCFESGLKSLMTNLRAWMIRIKYYKSWL